MFIEAPIKQKSVADVVQEKMFLENGLIRLVCGA